MPVTITASPLKLIMGKRRKHFPALGRRVFAVWEYLLKSPTKPQTLDEIVTGLFLGPEKIGIGKESVQKAKKALLSHGLIEECEGGGILPAARFRPKLPELPQN